MPTFASASATLCEAFQATVARDPDKIAIRTPGGASTLTFREWDARVRRLAAGFAALGVGRGDRVALMMTNRPEFYPIDVALQHLGAIAFSVYNTSSPEQIDYVLVDSGARVIVCEEQFVPVIRKGVAGTPTVRIVCLDAAGPNTVTLEEVGARGLDSFDFESAWRAVQPDDVLTLIYTSGTTGDPKGVQLTHANMLAMVDGTEQLTTATAEERVLSFLPSAHAADRWSAIYMLEVIGNQVTTVADARTEFAAALVDVRPTVFGAVPQVWQKLKAGIELRVGEASGARGALVDWALWAGRRASDMRLDGDSVPWPLRLQAELADRLVLSELRAAVGLDRVRLALSGAAPISPEVLRFFNGVGIAVSDAWGMSELAGMATMSPPGKVRLGTVGAIVPGSEIRIAEDGEVLVRGPIVMKGYLNKPDKTAETIDADGWVHTGDIGALDDQGYLRIVDRKKELIINAAGKNMSPSVIENWIKAFAPLIGQAVAIGDNRKYNVALICLDPDAAAIHARQAGLTCSAELLATDPGVHAIVETAVAQANTKLSRVEQIKRFAIVPDFWQPGTDVLTPTMKLRRKPIAERYAGLIEGLYR
ncbi:AMP-dependent synthetase/ligase [Nocardia sp. NPDC056000]|uniref:AMP-dependent synthetase/ligase n=1 Tax=Nocardia sp. NPDC056000 TaxID=3345674 RepID=UPI0035D8EF06